MKEQKQPLFPGTLPDKTNIPEEFTVYATGAGLYSWLNALAQLPETFDQKPFELRS